MAVRTYTHVVAIPSDGEIDRAAVQDHMVKVALEDGFGVEEATYSWAPMTRVNGELVLGEGETEGLVEAFSVMATFGGEEFDPGHVGEVVQSSMEMRG